MPKNRRRGLEIDSDIEAMFENLDTSEEISDVIDLLGKLIHKFETKSDEGKQQTDEEWFVQIRHKRWQDALTNCIVALHEILSSLESQKEKQLQEIKAHFEDRNCGQCIYWQQHPLSGLKKTEPKFAFCVSHGIFTSPIEGCPDGLHNNFYKKSE
jgi:hypothetical protein